MQRIREGVTGANRLHETQGFDARGNLFDAKRAIGAGLKELLLPKSRSEESTKREHAKAQTELERFACDPAKAQPKGLFCSNLISRSLPVGKNVVPGKGVTDVIPSDYLRSKIFKPVGTYHAMPISAIERVLQHGPTMARLGVGAAGAAGIYGLSRLLGSKKEHPQEESAQAKTGAEETPAEDHTWRNRLLAGGAALGAGLGTYKLMRTPSFSSHPGLRNLQQQAQALPWQQQRAERNVISAVLWITNNSMERGWPEIKAVSSFTLVGHSGFKLPFEPPGG